MRVLAAAVAVTAELGCEASTVIDIAIRAEIQRPDFHRHFAGKEDCFLAAYERIVEWLGEMLAPTIAARAAGPDEVKAVLQRTIRLLASDPRLARFCGFEAPLFSPTLLARHQANVERLAALLRASPTSCAFAVERSPQVEENIVAAAIWAIANRAREEDPERLLELGPQLTYLLLVPYLGVVAAREAADRGIAPPRGS